MSIYKSEIPIGKGEGAVKDKACLDKVFLDSKGQASELIMTLHSTIVTSYLLSQPCADQEGISVWQKAR